VTVVSGFPKGRIGKQKKFAEIFGGMAEWLKATVC
jgi:hypothetical protein